MRSLDFCRTLWLSGLPQNLARRSRRLCRAPHDEKSGFSCFCHQRATGASCGRGYILADQRPVSVRTGGLARAGERCFAFFCVQIPKSSRFFMIRFFLSSRSIRRGVPSLSCRASSTLQPELVEVL